MLVYTKYEEEEQDESIEAHCLSIHWSIRSQLEFDRQQDTRS